MGLKQQQAFYFIRASHLHKPTATHTNALFFSANIRNYPSNTIMIPAASSFIKTYASLNPQIQTGVGFYSLQNTSVARNKLDANNSFLPLLWGGILCR